MFIFFYKLLNYVLIHRSIKTCQTRSVVEKKVICHFEVNEKYFSPLISDVDFTN